LAIQFASYLADALDASLALLQSGGVPGQVDVDEAAEPLEVQPLRGCVRAEQQLELARPDARLQRVALTPSELPGAPYAGAIAAGI